MYLHQSVNKYTVIYTCVIKPMTFCRCVKEDHAHLRMWRISIVGDDDDDDVAAAADDDDDGWWQRM